MENAGWVYGDRVPPEWAGRTVLAFYCHHYSHSDGETWCQRITTGQILLEGERTSPETLLQRGQRLTYHRSPWQEPEVPLEVPVLYRDDEVWAVAKPSGLPVLPGGEFVYHTVLHQLGRQYPGESLTPVHRLGRGTSGVLLLGRSPLGKRSLSQQLRDHQCHKVYRALIEPGPIPETFTCHQPIGPQPYSRLGFIHCAWDQGKPAITTGQVLARYGDRTLVEVTIKTGRPHQIRIHLAYLGYPLLQDPLYRTGGRPDPTHSARPSDDGYWLHAHHVGFFHPQSGQWQEITAPPPPQLQTDGERANPSGISRVGKD